MGFKKRLASTWLSIPSLYGTQTKSRVCVFFFSCTPGLIFWTTFRDTPCESELIYLVTQVRAMICCLLIVHNPVWELHTSAAMPPSLLFSVASTTIVETYHEPMNQVYIFNL